MSIQRFLRNSLNILRHKFNKPSSNHSPHTHLQTHPHILSQIHRLSNPSSNHGPRIHPYLLSYIHRLNNLSSKNGPHIQPHPQIHSLTLSHVRQFNLLSPNNNTHILSHLYLHIHPRFLPHIRFNQSFINSQSNLQIDQIDYTPIMIPLQEHPKILPEVLKGLNVYSVNLVRKLENERIDKFLQSEKESRGEFLQSEKERRGEFLQSEERRRDEFLKFYERRTDELIKLKEELFKVRTKLEDQTENLLRAKDRLHIRGALEYIREEVTGSQKSLNEEPKDRPLINLLKDKDFSVYLEKACKTNQIRRIDVERCIGNLYHTVSKGVHGKGPNVILYQKDWEATDLFALGSVFSYFHIKYEYKDENERDVDFPFKFEEKLRSKQPFQQNKDS